MKNIQKGNALIWALVVLAVIVAAILLFGRGGDNGDLGPNATGTVQEEGMDNGNGAPVDENSAGAGVGAGATVDNGQSSEEPVFCTQDAKICPDGSYVGRVPPSCEFAACPGGIIPEGK